MKKFHTHLRSIQVIVDVLRIMLSNTSHFNVNKCEFTLIKESVWEHTVEAALTLSSCHSHS